MYRRVRESGPGEAAWSGWVGDRNHLFATHFESPIEDPSGFTGLPYFQYDPIWRTSGQFTPGEDEATVLEHDGDGTTRFAKVGMVDFEVAGHMGTLDVLWLDAYGGGIFLPFRDVSNGQTTYGGGRYLLDTVKGADLGHEGADIVLDFNYSYHPSCVHSYRWSCPLAPPANGLAFSVEAGERLAT